MPITLKEAQEIIEAAAPAFAVEVGKQIHELEERLEQKYESRFTALEQRMKDQEGFRGRIALVYGAISAIALLVWGAVSEWVKAKLTHKP